MRNNWEITFKASLIIIITVLIVGYGLFRLKDLIAGPTIILEKPQTGDVLTQPLLEIKGQAKRISLLHLNGRRIFTDKNGYFKEALLLAEGYNIITLEARDKFNRTTEKVLRLVYQSQNNN